MRKGNKANRVIEALGFEGAAIMLLSWCHRKNNPGSCRLALKNKRDQIVGCVGLREFGHSFAFERKKARIFKN